MLISSKARLGDYVEGANYYRGTPRGEDFFNLKNGGGQTPDKALYYGGKGTKIIIQARGTCLGGRKSSHETPDVKTLYLGEKKSRLQRGEKGSVKGGKVICT